MKIRISTLPADGLNIRETTSLESLNERMNEGRHNDITFTQAPEVTLNIHRTPTGAQTHGTIRSKYTQPCARCLDLAEQEVEVEANFVLLHKDNDELDESETSDDIGLVFYEGDHVELDELIEETLILTLSRYWKPPTDETGKCLRCGLGEPTSSTRDTEQPVTLSDLFKKAGVKIQ